MNQSETAYVIDTNGQRGIIESMPSSQPGATTSVGVRLENGQKLLIPLEVLTPHGDGTFSLPFSLAEFVTSFAASSSASGSSTVQQNASVHADPSLASMTLSEHQSRNSAGEIVIPLAAEQVLVGKRVVETGGVRIIKTVSERQETIDAPLIADYAEVERVAINRVVETAPEVRREGETLIVPLLEEVLVVEKRLMLKEELHIRMRREETTRTQQVTLRREDVQIERFAGDQTQSEASASFSQNSAAEIQVPSSNLTPEAEHSVLS